MKFSISFAFMAALLGHSKAQNTMVKMCLFYENPSGHARSDPIIDQKCSSGHVHTFYGPQNFHPDTTYEDIRDTPPRFSSTPFVENQSLYWHPSIYQVTENGDGTKTYTRVDNLETSPYYRWDNSVIETKAFPPGFRMIAHSDDPGADNGGELGFNMFTACCDLVNGDEDCQSWNKLHFPTNSCDVLEIALSMPTCWDGISNGDDNDHKSHMKYTTTGEVNGPCPANFETRLPQVQLFVRIIDYKGGTYQLSDGADTFHVDFFNGWKEGKLQEIIDNCPLDDGGDYGYNPPCGCTPDDGDASFLTPNDQVALPVCDADVRSLILDEATDVTNKLPAVSCEGPTLIPKSWDQLTDGVFSCTPTRAPTVDSGDEDGEGSGDEDFDEGSGDEDFDEGSGDEDSDEGSGDEDFDEGSGDQDSDEGSGDEDFGSGDEDFDEGSGDEDFGSGDEDFDESSGDEDFDEGSGDEDVDEGSGDEDFDEGSGDDFDVDEICYDRQLKFGNDAAKDCDWVAENPNMRCGKEHKGKAIWEYCPVSCKMECWDCCDISLFECEETIEDYCGALLKECAVKCQHNQDEEDLHLCIEEECEEEIEECHGHAEEECMVTFEACEGICGDMEEERRGRRQASSFTRSLWKLWN